MNIGLDIDNVITAFDEMILRNFLIEDKKKRNKGIINPKAPHINDGMFDWSDEEVQEFYVNNMERLAKDLKTRKNCKKYMDKLIEDGHTLILISHRAFPHYQQPEKTTLDWLTKRKINYHKLVLSKSPDKSYECKKYKIDIMVDDRPSQCKKMAANGIDCILMFTKYKRQKLDGIGYAKSWADLYKEISEWRK